MRKRERDCGREGGVPAAAAKARLHALLVACRRFAVARARAAALLFVFVEAGEAQLAALVGRVVEGDGVGVAREHGAVAGRAAIGGAPALLA